ncbi:MAG: HypC/HybG/HupF family hydrogenase formation chaperone, partial [Myxococcales bacterium]|nr:HypC/HybG/HupF family hydrogenase formation chaperone [Myxococcales bacterium]
MCLAVPGKLVSAEGEGLEMRGRVDFGGVSREIQLAFVPEARV